MYNAAGQLERDQLVQSLVPLVRKVAHHLMARLPPSVQVDDLIQNGMIGLLDAIGRYETGFGAQFETYATQRVRGAMLDGLRETDWLPRSVRREMRRIEEMISRLEQAHGRPPIESELAAALGMPLPEYQNFEDLVEAGEEDFLERHFVDDGSDPLQVLEEASVRETLVRGIEELPEREKLVMALYYEQDLNLREIGEVMGVTESRVCQLHSQAVARLRNRMLGCEPIKKKRGRPRKQES
jgi:RNA polymerase sigma factor for flagellar operon FliA